MKCFLFGKVVEPLKNTDKGYVKFGCLSGRSCDEYTVWATAKRSDGSEYSNPLFDKALKLSSNDDVALVTNVVVTKDNKLGVYIQDLAILDTATIDVINDAFDA